MKKMLRRAFQVAVVAAVSCTTAFAQVVEYYHSDSVGSVQVVTNAAGTVIERHDYLPFGEEWVAQPGVQPIRFAGKPRDLETGLDYFGARYYGSTLGRFTSVDPVMNVERNLVEPQSWNRYSYVTNNPYRFIDPDGRDKIAEFFLGAAGRDISTWDALTGAEARAHYAQVAEEHPFLTKQLAVASVLTPGPEDLAMLGLVRGLPQGAKLLSTFTRSTVDDVIASAARVRGQTTEGARAIQKKLGHAQAGGYKSAFEGVAPTQQNAESIINGVLTNPSRTVIGNKTIDAYNAAGQGVRFEAGTGRFVGFIEETLATR